MISPQNESIARIILAAPLVVNIFRARQVQTSLLQERLQDEIPICEANAPHRSPLHPDFTQGGEGEICALAWRPLSEDLHLLAPRRRQDAHLADLAPIQENPQEGDQPADRVAAGVQDQPAGDHQQSSPPGEGLAAARDALWAVFLVLDDSCHCSIIPVL
jgi:hypothetical protein